MLLGLESPDCIRKQVASLSFSIHSRDIDETAFPQEHDASACMNKLRNGAEQVILRKLLRQVKLKSTNTLTSALREIFSIFENT